MSKLKYKVGDKVKIKSLDWYNENKDEFGIVECGNKIFTYPMTKLCGKTVTIICVNTKDCYYVISGDDGYNSWTDEMIECKVEEETKIGTASNPTEIKSNANCLTRERVDELPTKIDKELPYGNPYEWGCPEGYQFVDDDGNVINATKIVLLKKKREYPKTYEECCTVLRFHYDHYLTYDDEKDINPTKEEEEFIDLMDAFSRLIVCRNAYWKIAGDEMGLDKPWEPDWREKRYIIYQNQDDIIGGYREAGCAERHTFEFPTKEMRDAFKENFKELIEDCKELL